MPLGESIARVRPIPPGVPMILLGSFLHHEPFADLLGRCLEDRVTPEDARDLKRIINLNSYCLRLYSNAFAGDLFRRVLGTEVRSTPAYTKGALKDFITANPPLRTPRIDELVQLYQRFPEDFYRETPYDGLIFSMGDPPRYVGSRRIKRVRRIAEKSARRIIDYMYDQIRQRADELAAERARLRGIPKEALITPPEEMAAEFQHAERRVLKSIRDGLFVAAMPQFYIDDVVGIRMVMTPELLPRFEDWLGSTPDIGIVDEKRFSGPFNGRNMVVAYRLPVDRLLATPPDAATTEVLVSRGLGATGEDVQASYRDFVRTAEGHVRFEILLIDFEQLLESEIGRSMHEEHIRAQRERQVYAGRLAQNVEALMIFLFGYALSCRTEFGDLPVKLRGTYLPDYFDKLQRWLYGLPAGSMGLTM